MMHYMELKSIYGGAKDGQRYYSYTLMIEINSKAKTVIYQSFPNSEPMPDAFRKIQEKIYEMVKKI